MSHAVEQIVLNNAYKVGRYSKPRPFHEDVNNKDQPFEPSAVRPGQTTRIRVDFKHGAGMEVVLNDIMLCFKVKCPTARMWCGGTSTHQTKLGSTSSARWFQCKSRLMVFGFSRPSIA